ncbi:hypothetical protein B0H13DRAFT_1893831 [Mycena leptocephala]|nr:hypothetical protein B0H13DRAFT_1893831 [Mycena leptocephala]
MVEIRDAEPHTVNSRRNCQSQFKNNKHSSSQAVPGDEAAENIGSLPPFPSDYTVVYIMTERQANDELRQIKNGAVGIDTEFTERRPTKEEYTILKSIPAGTNKRLALLGWQIGTSYALTPDGIVVWVLDMWKIRCIPKELHCILLAVKIPKTGVGLLKGISLIWDGLRMEMKNLVDCGMMARLLLAEKYRKPTYGNLSSQD